MLAIDHDREKGLEAFDKQETKAWFTRCIEENTGSLYSLGLRLTRNSANAQDLVADTVEKAWTALDSLQDRDRFRPWIFRILHNRFISEYRKQKCRPIEVAFDEPDTCDDTEQVASLLVQQSDDFLYWWANPEREFTNNLLGEDILQAIERLPEAFRVTVLLVNVEGLSYDEAAEVLDVSPGTVRSRMNRGRTLLQKALWEHARDAGLITDTQQAECSK